MADGLERLAGLLRDRRLSPGCYVIGVTGSVASGKSTVSAALMPLIAAWPDRPRGELACTDGFLLCNEVLAARELIARKGYPETYDAAALIAALKAVRTGEARFPGYSHATYDVDQAMGRRIARPDVLVIEGLGLGTTRPPAPVDILIYLDADEVDLATWFVDRFMGFWRRAADDPTSFYARFRGLDEAGAEGLARAVWTGINLPNLRRHILPLRSRADVVVRQDGEHRIVDIEGGPARRRTPASPSGRGRQGQTGEGRAAR
ncbi:MAG: hypothetical protein ABI376_04945 [Caulobacteraceae bacterium]